MKLLSAVLALGFYAPVAKACLAGPFTFQFEGECSRETLLEAYKDQVYSATGAIPRDCTATAEEDFQAKLDAAGTTAQEICDKIYDTAEIVPFTDAAKKGTDMHFEQMFFNGGGDWQEEIETIYETDDQSATSVLKRDAQHIRAFHEGIAQGRRVAWPGQLTNFQSSVTDSKGNPTCTTNAAMCCWPQDRQANDGNGNCADPEDVNCVNNDPADNTDLCYVDMEKGNASIGFDSELGFLGYNGDNSNGEGQIHCHGMAWSNDANDPTARYRGNNIFYVSMYDHMYVRGYVGNVPGAPMCGCVEQMPTVSRSDCTQVDLVETIKIVYDSEADSPFTGKLVEVDLTFNACQGIRNRKNDLHAYMAKLFYQGDLTPSQFGEAGQIITNTDCEEATRMGLQEKGLVPAFDHSVDDWTHVAGRDELAYHGNYGKVAFEKAMAEGADAAAGHHGIIRRVCSSCAPSHKDIYYRRLTAIPTDVNFISDLLYTSAKRDYNTWGEDFTLHSSYEDAVSGDKPWLCPNGQFDYGNIFVGRCSPSGEKVNNQQSRFNDYRHSKANVAYYVNKAEATGPQLETEGLTVLKGRDWATGTVVRDPDTDTIYINAAGRDLWHVHDDIAFFSEPAEGDQTVIVKVSNMQQATTTTRHWAKAGIQLRKSLETDSLHYSLMLSGREGAFPQWRPADGGSSTWAGWGARRLKDAKEAWLKVEFRIGVMQSFIGTEDDGGTITWELVDTRDFSQLGDSFHVGLFVSANHNVPLEVTFEGYEAEQFFFPSAAPSASPTPTFCTADTDCPASGSLCMTPTCNLATNGCEYNPTMGCATLDTWTGIGGSNLSNLKNLASFPDSPNTSTTISGLLQVPSYADNFGSRIQTWIKPEYTCDYTFYLASDDQGELNLSHNTIAGNKKTIASVPGWTSVRQWNKYASQTSQPQSLVAGEEYYLEALYKEGGGGDHIEIAWSCASQGMGIEVIDISKMVAEVPAGRKLRGIN